MAGAAELNCVLNNKVKIRPGCSSTLVQEILLPVGTYILVVEDDERIKLLKSHNFAVGSITISSKGGSEILKADLDFHKEYPFQRDVQIPQDSDGSEEQEEATIRIIFTVSSSAHIKNVRLSCKLLSSEEDAQAAHVISSQTTDTKKSGRKRASSNNSTNSITVPSDLYSASARSTPSNSFSELPQLFPNLKPRNSDRSSASSTASISSQDEDSETSSNSAVTSNTSSPANPAQIDVVEKDILYIQKNTTYSSEGVEQGNTTQIHLEHTKTISESSETTERSTRTLEKTAADIESLSSFNSQSAFDPSEENLVYYKESRLKKKIVTKEKIPIQQRGRYYVVIENSDKGPINKHFSCHLTLSSGEQILKESYTRDAKRKIFDDFFVETDSSMLTLELVNTTSASFGRIEVQISLFMKTTPVDPEEVNLHPHLRTGEVVWSVNKCEVEKKHPQKLSAKIPASGSYYIVVEKVDKIYGGLREISVNATLTEPPKEGVAEPQKVKIASAVVGGIKLRPMKWKSPVFVAPAGSVIDFTIESFAIVGSIVYSLRIRKVPGLTAEQERTRKMVLAFLAAFGVYYLLFILISIVHFIQDLGFTLRLLFISIDITLGRICCILFIMWFRTNQEVLVPVLKDIRDTVRKIARKIKYIRDMSDGGTFDILRIFKQMSREGKANDRKKWERQKMQTANE